MTRELSNSASTCVSSALLSFSLSINELLLLIRLTKIVSLSIVSVSPSLVPLRLHLAFSSTKIGQLSRWRPYHPNQIKQIQAVAGRPETR